MTIFVRHEFNYDMSAASKESGLDCTGDVGQTKQSFAEEVDINTIVRRFGLTGEMPADIRMPAYGDFTGISDFSSAMNAIAQAREQFESMPANVRARFNNDPQRFLEFCEDAGNLEEARKLGLTKAIESGAALAGVAGPSAVGKAAEAAAVKP